MGAKESIVCFWICVTLLMVPSAFCVQNACGGTFTASNGTIQSPGYPGNYSNNLDCVYVISRPEGERITLTFDHFDLQDSGSECPNDFVEIRDGSSETSPLFIRACNNTLPSPRKSFGNAMRVRFRSDGSVTGTGFSASYTSGVSKDKFFLITSSKQRIYQMDVDTGTNRGIPVPNLFNPIAIDYDPVERRIYWTDVILRQILSAYLNGSDNKPVKLFNASAVLDGLAVDPISRLIFYTDAGNDVIGMMGMSGNNHRTILSTDLDKPRAIVLDTMNGVMFWTDWGTTAKIERANYDGTDRRTLHNYFLAAPNALAVDLQNNRLYWVDAGTDLVEWSDLDGNSRSRLYTLSGTHLFGMTYYDNMLYVTDWTGAGSSTNVSYLHKLNTAGTFGKTFGSVPGRLNDIHIYVQDEWQKGPNGCGDNNGGCPHICIPAERNTSKCLCPDNIPCVEESYSTTTTSTRTTTNTTSATTTTTSGPTSLPRPITVSVSGPTTFDTDGTKEMTLTCDPDNQKPIITVTWSVPCTTKEGRKCAWVPALPGDDGKVVTCSIVYTDGQSGMGSFRTQLNYPPPAPPKIHGYNVGDILNAGDAITMTCLVRGGKPLVKSVIFSCPGHPDVVQDIHGDAEVQSLLTIHPLRSTDNGTRCICTAEWKRTDLYALSATRILIVEGVLPQPEAETNTVMIVGAAAGAGLFVVIVVVVAVIVFCRKGGRRYESPSRPPPEVELNPYSRLGQPGYLPNPQLQGYQGPAKDEDTNSLYAEIQDEEQYRGAKKPLKSDYDSLRLSQPGNHPCQSDKPDYDALNLNGKPVREKPVPPPRPGDYRQPGEPADDYLQPVKAATKPVLPETPASDYLHPAKPDEDYLHPTNPTQEDRKTPTSDYLHPTKPDEDYLHPTNPAPKERETPVETPAVPAKQTADYLHPTKPASDYLHPTKPASDYLHPTKPAVESMHPEKPAIPAKPATK